jgi:hypothetical protein
MIGEAVTSQIPGRVFPGICFLSWQEIPTDDPLGPDFIVGLNNLKAVRKN